MLASRKLLFSLFSILLCGTTASDKVEVYAYTGGEARVSCSYPAGYETYEKYLCAKDCGNNDILVTTTQQRANRYFTSDQHQTQIFTVTISNVQASDAGKYWCGVSRSGKDIYTAVTVHVKSDECCDSVHSIQRYEGSTVSIICPHQREEVNSFKYVCKGSQPSTCRKRALVTATTKQNTLELSAITKQDAGSYLCGVERSNNFDDFSRVELTVFEWCCVSSRDVKGFLGQSVTLQCPYPSEHHSNTKFLCKGEQRATCQTVVNSTAPRGRFSLQEAHPSFSVTITGLGPTDAGTYWCGSDSQWTAGKNYTKIQLTLEWCCVSSRDVKGFLEQSVTLQCPYPSEHRSNTKFLCKGEQRATCQTVVSSTAPRDRFSLQEAHPSFSVTITRLRLTDAGTYWCGSDSQWTAGKHYTKIQLTLEYLKVTTVTPTNTTNRNGSETTLLHKDDRESNNARPAKEEMCINKIYSNQDASKFTEYRLDNDQCVPKDESLYENFSNEPIYGNC
ncbi:polymeric immunoglobulin receptor-like isoform X2 [Boleophthalmus pectinirostris]|uniref:polymeric immunoglobulin receptor-like isoform X2 n=1 Tax=Boleophthalmus pectinirostris TaxID=150288 RepID=UPI00242ACF33|nr:polymeric immunoglobulin receptor-like isoform X2 [Boleophthalmus pectinirostris]